VQREPGTGNAHALKMRHTACFTCTPHGHRMKILLTGATGFIGSHLRQALLDAGHTLLCVSRQLGTDGPGCHWAVADFAHTSTTRWSELLRGIDAVVNAAGVFCERDDATFAAVHGTGPRRLFAACVHAGVQRVVHVSALGADAQARTEFHLSKFAADEHLLSLPLEATVLLPSLVFGLDGAGTRALLGWASLPIVPLPAGGHQMVQPVHVVDVSDTVLALLREREHRRDRRIALVGPVPLSLRDYLGHLRSGLGLPAARTVDVPDACVRAALRVTARAPRLLFDRTAWQTPARGNVGDASAIAGVLGRVPRAAARFIEPAQVEAARRRAQLGWRVPLVRAALAAAWIATAILAFAMYPVPDSYALLPRAGVLVLLVALWVLTPRLAGRR
jgi:uncharacterized protein YbjT (DUF2867 family)